MLDKEILLKELEESAEVSYYDGLPEVTRFVENLINRINEGEFNTEGNANENS